MFSILSFNAALQDIRLFGRSFHCPVGYVDERMAVLPGALQRTGADLILLQEMFHRCFQDRIYRGLQQSHPYIAGRGRGGLKLRLDNELLVMSRYPLDRERLVRYRRASLEEAVFTRKGFFHCTLHLPEVGAIEVINFHTTAGGVHTHPEHDRMEQLRAAQIEQMLEYAAGLGRVILAGDLNAGPHTSHRNFRQILDRGYLDLAGYGGDIGYTWDRNNPLVAEGEEHHLPYQRIDHIFINPALAGVLAPVTARVVLKDRCVTTGVGPMTLSDHYGVLGLLRPAVAVS